MPDTVLLLDCKFQKGKDFDSHSPVYTEHLIQGLGA